MILLKINWNYQTASMEEIHTNSNQFIASQMDEEILHETRSEEVQEIIGTMPHWIIRCGIGILTSIVLAVFLGCAFVKLPEYVGARVSIMPSIKPTPVSVKASGIIQNLLVNDGGKVNKGQVLAIIDNNSHYTDVLKIKEIAIKIDTTYDLEAALLDVHLETRLHIGELQRIRPTNYILRSCL